MVSKSFCWGTPGESAEAVEAAEGEAGLLPSLFFLPFLKD